MAKGVSRWDSPDSTSGTATRTARSPASGNTLIGTLRKIYGRGFAPGCSDDNTLEDELETMQEASLSQLVHDHHRGELDGKITRAAA